MDTDTETQEEFNVVMEIVIEVLQLRAREARTRAWERQRRSLPSRFQKDHGLVLPPF